MSTALCLDVSLTATGYLAVALPFAPVEMVRHGGTYVERASDPTLERDGRRWCGELPTGGPKEGLVERAGRLARQVGELLDDLRPTVVAAEQAMQMFTQGSGKTSSASMQMQQWSYAACAIPCWLRGIPLLRVDPKWPKEAVAGQANAGKPAVAAALALRYGVAQRGGKLRAWPGGWGSNNVRDALCVAIWLEGQYRIYGDAQRLADALLVANGERPLADWLARSAPASPRDISYQHTA